MSDHPRISKSRGLRKALIVVVCCLIFALAAALLVDGIGAARRAKAISEAYEHGGPVTFEEILAARPELPEERNAANVFTEFRGHPGSKEAGKGLPLVGDGDSPAFGQRWSDQMHEAVGEFLDLVSDEIEQIDELRKYERGAFPVDLTVDPTQLMEMEINRLSRTRYCVKLKSLQVLHRAMAGDTHRLCDDLQVLLRHADVVANTPLLISFMTCIACDALAVSIIEDYMAVTSVPPDQLLCMQELLASRDVDSRLARAMRGERAYLIAFAGEVRSGSSVPGLKVPLPGVRGWLMWDEGFGIRLYTQLLEVAEDPSKTELLKATVASAKAGFSLTGSGVPSMLRPFELSKRHLTEYRCAQVALAAERYRLHTGAWPTQLRQLTPEYIQAIPHDPFAPDRSLKLARTDNRLVIYSVGSDGQDDGGDVQRGNGFARGLDTGFILLDPAVRNQPATSQSRPSSSPTED